MTVAVYLQVSRFFPHEISQRAAIQQLLTQSDIAPSSVHWFIDREDKSEFQQLSKDIEVGAIRTLIIYSIEQAYTSLASIKEALGLMAVKEMSFAAVSQNIYFDKHSISSAVSLLSISLELASTYQKMRQKQGIDQARAKGLYKGKKPGATKPGFDPKKILRWKARGWNAKRIAVKLGVAESTVFRYLRILKGK